MAKGRCKGCLDCLCLFVIYPFVVIPLGFIASSAKDRVQLWRATRKKYPCTDAEGLAAETTSSTGLKVILPSIGQTGTTSVHWALCRMGLKSFHAEERSVFAYQASWDINETDTLVSSVSRCRLDALSLEPTWDSFPVFMQFSPGAKVILTWRDFPSWTNSSMGLPWFQDLLVEINLLFARTSMRIFGWGDWWDLLTGRITRFLDRGDPFSCGFELDFERFLLIPLHTAYFDRSNIFGRGSYKVWNFEEAYLAHLNEIQVLTPPGDLLVFNVKRDSWDKLENFLGLSAGEHAKQPFPRPRQHNLMSNNVMWRHHPSWVVMAQLVYAALASVNFAILLPLLRLLRWCLRRLCCRCCSSCAARDLAQKRD